VTGERNAPPKRKLNGLKVGAKKKSLASSFCFLKISTGIMYFRFSEVTLFHYFLVGVDA
jgi:hypothetical protein